MFDKGLKLEGTQGLVRYLHNPQAFDEGQIKDLTASLSKQPGLSLDDTPLNDKELVVLFELLEETPAIKAVTLVGCQINDEGATVIAKALKSNITISGLSLHRNNICEIGAIKLAKALEKNTTLTNLVLSANKIGVHGVKQFAETLKKNIRLIQLDTCNNKISEEGSQALLGGIKRNSNIIYPINNSYGMLNNRIKQKVEANKLAAKNIAKKLIESHENKTELPNDHMFYKQLYNRRSAVKESVYMERVGSVSRNFSDELVEKAIRRLRDPKIADVLLKAIAPENMPKNASFYSGVFEGQTEIQAMLVQKGMDAKEADQLIKNTTCYFDRNFLKIMGINPCKQVSDHPFLSLPPEMLENIGKYIDGKDVACSITKGRD